MPKHIVDLLTTLGVPAEDAAKIDSLPEAEQATFDAKPYVDKVRGNYQTQLQNDPEFFKDLTIEKLPADVKKRVENNAFGRASNIVKDKLLKGLGMSDADFEDLTPEQKEKIETLVPVIAERWTKTKSSDKQIQQEVINLRKQIEESDGLEEKIKTKYEGEYNQKYSTAILNANIISSLSEIPGLKIPAADIAATANQLLQSKYAFERVGDYSVELRQKANKDLKVLKPNSSHELSLKEALVEIATERGWVDKQEDADQKKKSGVVTIAPDKNGIQRMEVVAPHLQDKLKKKIEAEAKS